MQRRSWAIGLVACLAILTIAELAYGQIFIGRNRGWRGDSWGVGIGDGGVGFSYGRGYYGSPYGYGYRSPYSYGYSSRWGSPYYYSDGYGRGFYPSRGFSLSIGSPYVYSGPGAYYYSAPVYSGRYVSAGPIVTSSYDSGTFGTTFGRTWNARADQAVVAVNVPANAEVFFENQATQQRGSQRVFISPSLDSGKTYTYTVKARWTENGQEMTKTKEIDVQAGHDTMVSFGDELRSDERTTRSADSDYRTRETRDQAAHREEKNANTHEGRVVRVLADKDQLVMSNGRAGEHTHAINADSVILLDGKKAELEDLKAGMRIKVTTKDGNKELATRIEATATRAGDTAVENPDRDNNQPPPPK